MRMKNKEPVFINTRLVHDLVLQVVFIFILRSDGENEHENERPIDRVSFHNNNTIEKEIEKPK